MFCKSSPNDEEHKLYTKQFFKTKKLLLLGTGESGKTTIIKQMRILHINGYSEVEKKEKIPNIKQNIHESIYDIINNMDKITPPIEIVDEGVQKCAEYILKIGPDVPEEFTEEYFDNVKTLWGNDAIQKAFKRSNEYQLIDSAEHFLNRLDDIRNPDYIPTIQDILFCRIMTVSISKIEFEIPVPMQYGGGTAEFWMYDVGGQRGQRKKWIQVFDGIEAILFLIAASDFDQTLREDHTRNRLEESFSVFKDICFSRFVRNAGLIVFLNKQDLLRRKIEEGRKLEKYFPDYAQYSCSGEKNVGAGSEYDRARLFMEKKIKDIANTQITVEHIGFVPGKNIMEKLPPRDVYVHFTIATDTNNIKKVFDSVHSIILKMNVIKTGIY